MRALTFHLAESHGWRIGYLTPEDPPHRLVRDMRRFAGRCVSRRSDPSWVDSAFYISQPPEDEPITLEMVENEMAAAALHHDCQAFVIDPWNEISHNYGRLSTDQYIEQSLRTLKRKARRYNMLLIIVAHPTKLDEEKKATLYTINGSANWRNKCDHGIIIHRPFLDAHGIHVIVEKCKDHETMGIPGTHFMRYIKDECEFVDDQQLQ
jgi:twinkle protein